MKNVQSTTDVQHGNLKSTQQNKTRSTFQEQPTQTTRSTTFRGNQNQNQMFNKSIP